MRIDQDALTSNVDGFHLGQKNIRINVRARGKDADRIGQQRSRREQTKLPNTARCIDDCVPRVWPPDTDHNRVSDSSRKLVGDFPFTLGAELSAKNN